MTFFKEAKLRWGASVPPFFKTVQAWCAAIVGLGGTITGVSFVGLHHNFDWLTGIGVALTAGGTIGGAVAQFVVTNIGLIIPPGGSIENKTDAPIEVKTPEGVTDAPDVPDTATTKIGGND